MTTTYLLLGTNMGNRFELIKNAQNLIREKVGSISKNSSSIYETAAWGEENMADYLNQVLVVDTRLNPLQLLQKIHQIEQSLGRKREMMWGPRTMDIDILFYDQYICNTPRLTIPHPHIPKRRFVLTPLAEIDPTFIHPLLNKSIQNLLTHCEDKLSVKKYERVHTPVK